MEATNFLESTALINSAYIVAAVLFILSLRGLSSQETARRGNLYGIIGMAIAIAATLTQVPAAGAGFHPAVFAAIGVGAVIGALMASRVGMTQMPELVALLHSFVGLAAVLVGYSLDLQGGGEGLVEGVMQTLPPTLTHRIDPRVPQAARLGLRQAVAATGAPHVEPRDAHRLHRVRRHVRVER